MIFRHPGRRRKPFGEGIRLISSVIALGAIAPLAGIAADPLVPPGTTYYSTCPPPVDQDGPQPADLPLEVSADKGGPVADHPTASPEGEAPRLASLADRSTNSLPRVPEASSAPALNAETPMATREPAESDPILTAKRLIAEAKARFSQVRDYTCTFYKRERIDGKLSSMHTMAMKVRSQPFSVYFKFVQPNAGREAIYVAGRNSGRVVAHDVGIGKFLAGTMRLDPRGSMAMEENRHPITEAGIAHLIDKLSERWASGMKHGECEVSIHSTARVNNRPCTMIVSTHPVKQPHLMFHTVKVYIDQEWGIPIRFEGYDWPTRPGNSPELVEEYTYLNLKMNVGLAEPDFDPSNKAYAFGRF
jgi:hypothetical protein